MDSNQLDDLKRTYDKNHLLALAEQHGLKVARDGRMQCPRRCSEEPRGCSVTDSNVGAVYHCKRCGQGGSVVDFIMAVKSIDLRTAIEELAGTPPPKPKERQQLAPVDGAVYWPRLAQRDVAGEGYLRGRGLEAAIPFVRFSIGAAGEEWLDAKASRGWRVAVPMRDITGRVVAFQLRSVAAFVTPKLAKLSLPGPQRKDIAFGHPELAGGAARVYLAEGMADSLALEAAGAVVLGAPGADQVKYLVALLGDVDGRDVVLCPQTDPTHHKSEKTFAAVGAELEQRGARVWVMPTPAPHKDPAAWLQAVGLEAFRNGVKLAGEFPGPLAQWVPAKPARDLLDYGKPTSDGTSALAPNVHPLPAPMEFRLTDSGNAERFVAMFGRDLRFCAERGQWFEWNATHWAEDRVNKVLLRTKSVARSVEKEAERQSDEEVREAVKKFARTSESARNRLSMLTLARAELPILSEAFDADHWVFNCENGTLDLRTGKLEPHARDRYCTKVAPVEYDAGARCPRWLSFLEEVQPDPEVRAYLQRLAGYLLTGVIREHVFPINYGRGRNGKGVWTNTLMHVMGDYAKQVPTELLMEKKGEAHPTERAVLLGCRFAATVETEEGRALNVGLVKQLTGGDPIPARFMRQDFFMFWPTHKLVLSTNHRPRIKETKDAIWERVHLIPWDVQIPEEKRDPDLVEKLRGEAAGILAWAVEGCRRWQAMGLAAPAAIRGATSDYRQDQDVLGDFLNETCAVERNAFATVRELREVYERWCEENGEARPLGRNTFNERLRDRGFDQDTQRVMGKPTKLWRGLWILDKGKVTLDP